VCNVSTSFATTPATSTGKYTVCTPTASGSTFAWAITGPQDIQLVDGTTPANPVAGNPYGVAQIGNFLYIIEFDSAKIYTVNIANFEAATGATYAVDAITDASSNFTITTDYYAHGASILALTNGEDTYLYCLFTLATADSSGYDNSVVVRYSVDSSTGALTYVDVTTVGKNATALVPAPGGSDGVSILVPAIGGEQNGGTTNGTDSNLSVITDVFGAPVATTAFTGDAAGSVTPTGNYDIHSVAVSEDGLYAYLLTITYSANYLTNWRLFQTTVANILKPVTAETPQTLSEAVAAGLLVDVDSTANPDDGDAGYYWDLQYENADTIGRLWFVKGSPIRISMGNGYSVYKLIDAGSGGPLYSPEFNVNSADLIGEMIYQASQGVSKDTRLVKGTARQTAQAAQAVQTAQAASEEAEEK
jgi:hypothetical protein